MAVSGELAADMARVRETASKLGESVEVALAALDRLLRDGSTGDGILRDGGVAHPLLAELIQHPNRGSEVASEDPHILTHEEYVFVAPHLFRHGHDDGIADRHYFRFFFH